METRIEILDRNGQILGFFFTGLSAEECWSKQPIDFSVVVGEWWPAGGVLYESEGPNAWFLADVVIGSVESLDDLH